MLKRKRMKYTEFEKAAVVYAVKELKAKVSAVCQDDVYGIITGGKLQNGRILLTGVTRNNSPWQSVNPKEIDF